MTATARRGSRLSFPPRFYRPTWAEVDLPALRSNVARFARRMGRAGVLFVVKADGYGHGAVQVARAAEETGRVSFLGVSSVEEGVVLREAGLRLPILILGSLYPFESALAAIRWGLTPTVASMDGARRLAQAARRLGAGRKAPLPCHLKVDTGMGRIGVGPSAAPAVAEQVRAARGLRLEGVYTHFSCAESDPDHTRLQLARFSEALAGISRAGCRDFLRHAANSAAALRYPKSRLDLVRPGIALYGLAPGFSPILSLKTRVVFLKNVRAGTPVSYGAAWRARRACRIATLPIGYADGVPRAAGGRGLAVLIRGRRCPVVGAITMDMLMADVTGVPGLRTGEEAVLIGRSGAARVGAEEIAAAAGTIPYEVLTGLKARVPRVYLR